MRPYIRSGDFVIVSSVDPSAVKIGEIVFYIAEHNSVMVHRIIGWRRKNGVRHAFIKGDACFGPPDKVSVQNILGRVVSIERNGRKKRLDTVCQRLLGLIFVIASPLTIWGAPILTRRKQIRLLGR
jgi:signal peptidase I